MPAGWRKGLCQCKIKRFFLGDGKLRRKSASQNLLILLNTPFRKKKRSMVDGKVRGRLTKPNGIACVERMSRRRKR